MEYVLVIALVLIVSAALTVRRCVVFEYQRGLLYNRGKFVVVLPPGDRLYLRPFHTITKVDIRTVNVTIPGQEVLSSDNIGLKISLAAGYRVADPYLALSKVVNYQETLYLFLQLNLREIISSLAVDDLLAQREVIGQQLYEKSTSRAVEIGLELLFVNIKDIMFPGELKNIFAQIVNARKEGLAALERARGESAALRSLANAASVFDNNPNLLQLRLFQVLEKSSGNTVVMLPPESDVARKFQDKTPEKSNERKTRTLKPRLKADR
ncbi:MAG TPA: slipin family protein [Anaerolineae bacterium]|nr:slipin family protein [Anaerolineae bacterium]